MSAKCDGDSLSKANPGPLVAHANRLPFDAQPNRPVVGRSIMFGRHILGLMPEGHTPDAMGCGPGCT